MALEKPKDYKNRIMDEIIKKLLDSFPCVYIKGPKWCGKTYSALKLSNSSYNLLENGNCELAEINPDFVLKGMTPRLIDEWSECPKLWDKIKILCDKRSEPGQFILSGSVNIDKEKGKYIHHSGAGRIVKILLRPCSLYETGDSNGSISLSEMFTKPDNCIGKVSSLSFDDMLFALVRGGWPYQFKIKNKKEQLKLAKVYIDSIVDDESSYMNKRLRERTKQFLKSLSRNVQTFTDDQTLFKDYISGDLGSTRNEYFELKKIFTEHYLLDYTLSWNSNSRSKTSIRSKAKISFVDPSIPAYLLGIKVDSLKSDFNTLGYLFENLVSRDIKVYMSSINGEVYQYRDRYNLEADLVVKNDIGDYGLIEVKLGDRHIDEGANNLLKIKNTIVKQERKNRTKLKLPKFLAVITSTNFAYKRPDGVYVLPIGALKN